MPLLLVLIGAALLVAGIAAASIIAATITAGFLLMTVGVLLAAAQDRLPEAPRVPHEVPVE